VATFPFNDFTVCAVATQDIKAGDEICLCYLEEKESEIRSKRQKALQDFYGFSCSCTRCKTEKDEEEVDNLTNQTEMMHTQ